MEIKVGTFNLNNLFSRYNFKGEINAIHDNETDVEDSIQYKFGPNDFYKIRTYEGRLVKPKADKDIKKIVDRIKSIEIDILAVQEVEDIDTLKEFNRTKLKEMYKYVALIEGNDPRLIDIGILSQYPIGYIASWQQIVHPDDPNNPVFGRDLLEIEIYNETRSKKLFTIFNNHLKSHYVHYTQDPVKGAQENNQRRKRQAEMVAKIVKERTRPNSSFITMGDMNDPPDSDYLKGFIEDAELNLDNALTNPEETCLKFRDPELPPDTAWTYRHKPTGEPTEYKLYDQI
jgi:endonuclease/exonuclease/phosphatase family metal-dependent hydrolase